MLSIETHIPVAVTPAAPGEIDQGPALELLRSLNLLALGTRSDTNEAQSAEAGHDIARLEAKIDLLVAMVGALVAEHAALPPKQTVTLSAESVRLNLAQSCPSGAAVEVALYLSAELPRPLSLPATVSERAERPDGTADCVLALGPLDPGLGDEFERYVFLRHRHMLSRQSAP